MSASFEMPCACSSNERQIQTATPRENWTDYVPNFCGLITSAINNLLSNPFDHVHGSCGNDHEANQKGCG